MGGFFIANPGCHWYRWCTLKKFETGPNGILCGWGETDSCKKPEAKISWHCPFKGTIGRKDFFKHNEHDHRMLLSKKCRNYVLFEKIVFLSYITTFCKLFSQTDNKKLLKKLPLEILLRVVFWKPSLFVNLQTMFLMFSCAVLQESFLECGVTIFIAYPSPCLSGGLASVQSEVILSVIKSVKELPMCYIE